MGTLVIGLINNAYLLRELWLTPIFLAGPSDLWLRVSKFLHPFSRRKYGFEVKP